MLLKGAYCVGEHFVDPHGSFASFANTIQKDTESDIMRDNKTKTAEFAGLAISD